MGKYGSVTARNHGWGKQLSYAGIQAIGARYGGGHYKSVAAHGQRWASFASWSRGQGLNDARKITRETVQDYARELVEAGYARSSIQNAISTINTTLEHMADGDRSRWVAPSNPAPELDLQRSTVRTEAPVTADREVYEAARDTLAARGHERAAAALGLARELGMRREEAVKADLHRLTREAARFGAVNVQEGAKGGRSAERWVPLTDGGREALARAVQASPLGSRNLIDPAERYVDAKQALDSARDTLKEQGVPGYHDARAAYACERYRELTGTDAPVVAGSRQVDRATDHAAREVIAAELGHGRRDVVAAYVGSSK